MTTVYVDSSALLKRVLVEPQSIAVVAVLDTHVRQRDLVTSSSLAWVEVWRSLRRVSATVQPIDVDDLADKALAGVAEFALTADVLVSARAVGTDLLRSLDAFHLASALAVGADVVLTYDDRLSAAAAGAGLGVAAPS